MRDVHSHGVFRVGDQVQKLTQAGIPLNAVPRDEINAAAQSLGIDAAVTLHV